jgi:predicted lipoprotein
VLGTITEFRLGSTDPNAFAYDASAQVSAYAELVHDAYAAAHAGAVALRRAIDGLLDDPSPETIDSARRAWIDAQPAYLRTEAFQFMQAPSTLRTARCRGSTRGRSTLASSRTSSTIRRWRSAFAAWRGSIRPAVTKR